MSNINPQISYRRLPPRFVIKEFITNEKACDYEKYLMELLNQSHWFLSHYPGGFTKEESQAHGECDAINKVADYHLDFKLFDNKSAFHHRSDFSPRKEKVFEGVTIDQPSRKQGVAQITKINMIFQDKNLEELNAIRENSAKWQESDLEYDISAALKILEVEKNILLFLPYEFFLDQANRTELAANCIADRLWESFENVFQYREVHAPEYDTFLCCVYSKMFLIYQVIDDTLNYCDAVDTNKLPTYQVLSQY